VASRIAAFAGSLRRKSYNRALIEAARELAPGGMSIEPIEIGGLPFYNADVEAEGDPASVADFKAALQQADGVLIATPEYNDGIPGVLGNALDWASRLPGRAPLAAKPVAIIGASPSQIGTARTAPPPADPRPRPGPRASSARAAGGSGQSTVRFRAQTHR
jgi:chromate reductase